MKRDNAWKRVFEIVPGFLTWSTLGGLFLLAFIRPLWVAIFVIIFDLYWVIRVGYLTLLLVFAYGRLSKEKKANWLKKCEEAGISHGLGYRDIFHAVLFPIYKEGPDVLIPSILALENSSYPKIGRAHV